MTTLPTWISEFAAQAPKQSSAEASWLKTRRQLALERFATEGWPTNKLEAWHHTSLAAMEQQSYRYVAPVEVAEQVKAVRNNEAGHWLVFVNGVFDAGSSDIGELPKGVQLGSLAERLNSDADSVQALFGEAQDGASPAALNLALATDGAVVQVASGHTLELPVHLVFISTEAEGASFPRNLIALEAGASATVVEHYLSHGDVPTLTNAVTRANVAQDAKLVHLKLQQENALSTHIADITVEQQKASNFESHSMSFGAKLARNNINTIFHGERCETLFNGLYYVNGRRHVDHNTVINHASPNCVSHEYYRGILSDMARGVFSGRIKVGKGADGTDAVQRSDSLLLSKLARSDARPELEIYADDVKCAHGATVGQLDEESLFYLRTRGLNEADARDILIYAFAAATLERIESEVLRARATAGISALLPGGLALGEQA
ncbi:Fe-S cluster assembly protein SufD [Paenalcaligenes niemegkensis]|uniref:Fe-S cluster assembly protein SufD n=1 Tax=Paenalcaligenes niemegkensis TaxID=2895469 RepID=UPI001EE8CFCE|nr:Fe-S cluster assembly protein SufD [Paenalcaligenes niemegkensis]MCQ9616457.1 Fe-S cluster assembly protein SufD [Paenalcaligenes niemegkensis]